MGFAKVAHEKCLRICIVPCEFGDAAGHPNLATEHGVLYAGEVEFDENGDVVRWSNLSGTYQCPDHMAFQAGLPLDRFWAVQVAESSVSNAPHPNCTICNSGGVLLHKIFSQSDEEFQTLQSRWRSHVHDFLKTDSTTQQCYSNLELATKERQEAITKYGYLSQCSS